MSFLNRKSQNMAGEVDLIWFWVRVMLERWRSFFSLLRDWSEIQKKHNKVPIEHGAWRDFDIFHDFSTISATHHLTIEPWVFGRRYGSNHPHRGSEIWSFESTIKKSTTNLPKNTHVKGFGPKTVPSYLLSLHTVSLLASHDFVKPAPKSKSDLLCLVQCDAA